MYEDLNVCSELSLHYFADVLHRIPVKAVAGVRRHINQNCPAHCRASICRRERTVSADFAQDCSP